LQAPESDGTEPSDDGSPDEEEEDNLVPEDSYNEVKAGIVDTDEEEINSQQNSDADSLAEEGAEARSSSGNAQPSSFQTIPVRNELQDVANASYGTSDVSHEGILRHQSSSSSIFPSNLSSGFPSGPTGNQARLGQHPPEVLFVATPQHSSQTETTFPNTFPSGLTFGPMISPNCFPKPQTGPEVQTTAVPSPYRHATGGQVYTVLTYPRGAHYATQANAGPAETSYGGVAAPLEAMGSAFSATGPAANAQADRLSSLDMIAHAMLSDAMHVDTGPMEASSYQQKYNGFKSYMGDRLFKKSTSVGSYLGDRSQLLVLQEE